MGIDFLASLPSFLTNFTCNLSTIYLSTEHTKFKVDFELFWVLFVGKWVLQPHGRIRVIKLYQIFGPLTTALFGPFG